MCTQRSSVSVSSCSWRPRRRTPERRWRDVVVISCGQHLKQGRAELAPEVAVSLGDSLRQHVALGAQVRYFPLDMLGVGVEPLAFPRAFDDEEDLVRHQFKRATTLRRHRWSVTGLVSFSPLLGRHAFLGRHLSYLDLRLTAGVGVAALDGPDGELAPTVPLGGGVRLFLTDGLALSAAVRDHLVFGPDGVQQLVLLTVGVALFVGERQRYCRTTSP